MELGTPKSVADGMSATAMRPQGAVEMRELLPLVIGVTGHRDLREEDRQELEARVLEVFQTLQARYPHTPLAVLSPLAEGADRLIARVALAHGIRLIAPLPLDCDDYETDFHSADSREEFRELLGQADPWFALPTDRALSRDESYARVGAYIASRCQIMLAFWDGTDNGREGGTAQIVKFKLEGVPRKFVPENSLLDIPETGPVYHLITPRVAHTIPERKLSLVEKYPGSGSDESAKRVPFERIFEHMDSFNRDAVTLGPMLAGERAQSISYILGEDLPAQQTAPQRLDLVRYAVADTLAQHFQRKTHQALKALIVLVFILASLFQAHVFLRNLYKISEHKPPKPWYMTSIITINVKDRVYLTGLDVIYFGLLIVAIVLFRRALGANYQNKYLDYRAIAEGLRVQYFWRLAGLGDSVADHYLRKQKGDLDWIRNAVRIGDLVNGVVPRDGSQSSSERLSLVRDRWVLDQGRFFTKRASLAVARSRWVKRIGNWSYYVGLAFLIFRAFAPPDHPIIIALVLALAMVLLINLYAKVTAFSEHAKQYRRMSTLFAHASEQLKRLMASGDVDQAIELLRELGKESLAENGDWVLMHRERPLELPRA